MPYNIVWFRVHNCDSNSDATVMWLQPDINKFIFCEAAANHNAGISMGMVNQL